MINLLDSMRRARTTYKLEAEEEIDWDYDNEDDTHNFDSTQSWRRDPDPYNLHRIPLDIRLKDVLGEEEFNCFL